MDSEVNDVKKYSVILGFSMIVIFIIPCVLLAFFSKYLVRSGPTSKKSLRTLTSATTMTTEVLAHCVQYAHNKLTFLEKIGGGFGTCSELWKAYLPAEPGRRAGGRSEDHTVHNLVCIRKLQESQELHFQCLKAEFNLLSSIPPHPHILNLVGITVNSRRPSFLTPGASQSDPAGLLFEYPCYGRLFAFLCAKRRAIVAGNRASWNVLQQTTPTDCEQPYLLQGYTCNYAVNGSDASSPFLKPLGDPLDELDLYGFALQITSAMEYLASRKLLHKRLCSECVAVTKDFYLKVTDIDFEVQQLHKSTPPSNIPAIRKSPSGRRMFRWDAPEVLSSKEYTERSEVWRFGMTLWEVASLGETPFDDTPDSSTLLSSLQDGRHPQKPTGCPDHLYEVMEYCWNVKPDKRPIFSQVMEMLLTEFDSVVETGRKEAGKPLDTTSGTSSIEVPSSSPDRLIPPVSFADNTAGAVEERRGSYPLTHRGRGSSLRSNGLPEATTAM